jgi:hypothetical protein
MTGISRVLLLPLVESINNPDGNMSAGGFLYVGVEHTNSIILQGGGE